MRKSLRFAINPPLPGALMKIKPATKHGKIIVELNSKDQSILGEGGNANNKSTPFKLRKLCH